MNNNAKEDNTNTANGHLYADSQNRLKSKHGRIQEEL